MTEGSIMLIAIPAATRRLFLASLVFFVFSLVFSITNVITVLSAPLHTAVTVPPRVGFQGYAADGSGVALATGSYTVTVNVYDAATAGASKWQGIFANTPIINGLYSLSLQGPFTDTVFNGDRWLGVKSNTGTEISPRSKVASVPFALNAEQAQHVDWSGLNGVPAGFADGTDNTTGGLGTAATGRVALYDSASSVAGYAGLTYASNALTTSGGVNVGTASGAAAGEIRTSSSLVPGVGTRIKVFQYYLASGANTQVFSDEAKPNAVVLVMNISNAQAAQYYLRGNWNAVSEMLDNSAAFSPTAGTASYRLQNNTGFSMYYNVVVFAVL
jgi:hypothetical protein